ncbi:MAG: hypothetical protein ACRCUE_00150 [Bosea sp. (in: a-proteobacteria)]
MRDAARPDHAFEPDDGNVASTPNTRRPRVAKKRKAGKVEPFDAWLQARIPGLPKPAVGGYDPAKPIATMKILDGNEEFGRRLISASGWHLGEPRPAFDGWSLVDPEGNFVATVQFWTSRSDRPFGIGQDATGARWWITPSNSDEETPQSWDLKRQAPKLIAVSPVAATRAEADAVTAAFLAAGHVVKKLPPQKRPEPRKGGKVTRRWGRSNRSER